MNKNKVLEKYFKTIKIGYSVIILLNVILFSSVLALVIIFWEEWNIKSLTSLKTLLLFISLINLFLMLVYLVMFGTINAIKIKNVAETKKENGYKYFLSLFINIKEIKIIFPNTKNKSSFTVFLEGISNSLDFFVGSFLGILIWFIPAVTLFILFRFLFIFFTIKINKGFANMNVKSANA